MGTSEQWTTLALKSHLCFVISVGMERQSKWDRTFAFSFSDNTENASTQRKRMYFTIFVLMWPFSISCTYQHKLTFSSFDALSLCAACVILNDGLLAPWAEWILDSVFILDTIQEHWSIFFMIQLTLSFFCLICVSPMPTVQPQSGTLGVCCFSKSVFINSWKKLEKCILLAKQWSHK